MNHNSAESQATSPTSPLQPGLRAFAGSSQEVDYSKKWGVIAVAMIGGFMAPFDAGVVYMALPKLTTVFNVPTTTVEWVAIAYLLTITTFLLTWGRLGDMLGLKRLYLAGFALFTLGSVACAAAWDIWSLVAFRVLQAAGAGMFLALGAGIVTHGCPVQERGRALGMVGIAIAAGLTLGPNLGGLIIGYWGWRWVFLVNVPVGLLVILLGSRYLQRQPRLPERFDPWGAILSFLAAFPLLLALSQGENWGWSSPLVLALFAASVIGTAGFIVVEMRVQNPVLELNLFRTRLFTAPLISAVTSYLVSATVLFVMPFYLLQVRGFSPQHAGLLVTPVPLMTALVGPISGALSDRMGSRFLATAGLVVSGIGVSLLALLSLESSAGQIVFCLAIIGIGFGLFQPPNSSAVMGCVPRDCLGVASGMVATARSVGMSLGVSLGGMIIAVGTSRYLDGLLSQYPAELAGRYALLYAIRIAALVAGGACVLGALVSLQRGRAQPVCEMPENPGVAGH